jgi:hypothetical protein
MTDTAPDTIYAAMRQIAGLTPESCPVCHYAQMLIVLECGRCGYHTPPTTIFEVSAVTDDGAE